MWPRYNYCAGNSNQWDGSTSSNAQYASAAIPAAAGMVITQAYTIELATFHRTADWNFPRNAYIEAIHNPISADLP